MREINRSPVNDWLHRLTSDLYRLESTISERHHIDKRRKRVRERIDSIYPHDSTFVLS